MDGPVFISYSRNDKSRVAGLVNYLSKKGFPVWWDDDMQAGQRFRNTLGDLTDKASCIVVVWSASSVDSDFVRAEAEKGRKRGVLVPVLLDENIKIPMPFEEYHHANLSNPGFLRGKEIKKLVKILEALTSQGAHVSQYDENMLDNSWTLNNARQATHELRQLVTQLGSLQEIMTLDAKPVRDIKYALKEVEKTYNVVNKCISKFLDPVAQPGKIDPKPYIKIERGSLLSMIKKGHGHCTLILTHYMKVQGLRDWIGSKLDATRLEELDNVFTKLGTADGDLFLQMTEIGRVLTTESKIILNLLLANQQQAAYKRIMDGRTLLQPIEDSLTTAYNELQKIQHSLGAVI